MADTSELGTGLNTSGFQLVPDIRARSASVVTYNPIPRSCDHCTIYAIYT